MNLVVNNMTLAVAIIGVLAFIVSIITEVTKGIGVLSKIPTDLQVITVSLAICLLAYFSYTSYTGVGVVWYLVAGAIIISFIVAFIAMYGWEKFVEIWKRFNREV